MTTLTYDGSFEGLLSAIFDLYEYKFKPAHIVTEAQYAPSVFDQHHVTITDELKAGRVWKGLKQKISPAALAQFYKTFLSEDVGVESMLLQYAQQVFSHPQSIECDYANPSVLYVSQTAKKVYREKHRMEAFVRFQLLHDGLYYAVCQPDYNVLPLIEKHFKERYADQRWLIFDARRKYGIYYDLQTVEMVKLSFNEEHPNPADTSYAWSEAEQLYQLLWQQYFSSVNIVARKNTKLHIQHMPRRYWKYLPEKQTHQ
jgi:probable DNA metabolism protein